MTTKQKSCRCPDPMLREIEHLGVQWCCVSLEDLVQYHYINQAVTNLHLYTQLAHILLWLHNAKNQLLYHLSTLKIILYKLYITGWSSMSYMLVSLLLEIIDPEFHEIASSLTAITQTPTVTFLHATVVYTLWRSDPAALPCFLVFCSILWNSHSQGCTLTSW